MIGPITEKTHEEIMEALKPPKKLTRAEKSDIIVLDENENFQSVCKFCVRKLKSVDFEHVKGSLLGNYFIKRSPTKKLLYQIKKKLGREI